MRNLKKILALVLALVMSLSLMATAGATDFTDDADITDIYKESVDVLDGLKVFQGYPGGDFQPQGEIKRSEVAVIIYRIATGDIEGNQVGIYKDYNKFDDVTASHWAAGYINYCANAEYIKGRSAKVFDPEGRVTGYEALAMILRAIGYDKNNEFTGRDWKVQTAATAKQRGVIENITEGLLNQAATREMVAEILCQTILVNQVNYTPALGYQPAGTTLAYDTFKMEYLEGVVTGNEYADLEVEGSAMAAGRTRLVIDDREITLQVTSFFGDIGESRRAYVIPTAKSEYEMVCSQLYQTDYNDVKESGDATTVAALSGSLRTDAATEYFVNYDQGRDWTSDIRISYYISKDIADRAGWSDFLEGLAIASTPRVLRRDATGATVPVGQDDANGSALVAGYFRWIQPGEEILPTDRVILKAIFDRADLKGINPAAAIIAGATIVVGEVYVGTESNNDISDDLSYNQFLSTYVHDEVEEVTSNENGNYLKVIDNDNDGNVEYVLKTVFELDEVAAMNGDTVYYRGIPNGSAVRFQSGEYKYDGYYAYNDTPTLSTGTVVVAANIEGTYYAQISEPKTATIKTIVYATPSATTTDGDEYRQSGITNNTTMADRIVEMSELVEYSMYIDLFGHLRAYNAPVSGRYALLTEMYPKGDYNVNYVRNIPWVAEMMTPGTTYPVEQNVINPYPNTRENVFIDDVRAWNYGVLNRQDYLQSAVGHLGLNSQTANVVPGLGNGDNVQSYPAANQRTEFAWASSVGVNRPNGESYTNVAKYTKSGDGVYLYTASEFATENGAQLYYGWVDNNGNDIVDRTDMLYLADGTVRVLTAADEAGNGMYKGAKFTAAQWAAYVTRYGINLDPAKAAAPSTDPRVAGLQPVYAEDYIQMEVEDVDAGMRQFTMTDYNGANGYTGYVEAVNDTEFYIVGPTHSGSNQRSIRHFTGYSGLSAYDGTIAYRAGDIAAIYAVAENNSANSDRADYWVADVIVIELATNRGMSYNSISLTYGNPSETTGEIRRVNALNNETDGVKQVLYPNSIDWGDQLTVTGENRFWFYGLTDTQTYEDGVKANLHRITRGRYNANGIYAGSVISVPGNNGRGEYLSMDGNGDGSADRDYDLPLVQNGVKVPVYAVATNGSVTELVIIDYSSNSQITAGDSLIWVYNSDRQVDFIINASYHSSKRTGAADAYGNLYADILLEQSAIPEGEADFIKLGTAEGAKAVGDTITASDGSKYAEVADLTGKAAYSFNYDSWKDLGTLYLIVKAKANQNVTVSIDGGKTTLMTVANGQTKAVALPALTARNDVITVTTKDASGLNVKTSNYTVTYAAAGVTPGTPGTSTVLDTVDAADRAKYFADNLGYELESPSDPSLGSVPLRFYLDKFDYSKCDYVDWTFTLNDGSKVNVKSTKGVYTGDDFSDIDTNDVASVMAVVSADGKTQVYNSNTTGWITITLGANVTAASSKTAASWTGTSVKVPAGATLYFRSNVGTASRGGKFLEGKGTWTSLATYDGSTYAVADDAYTVTAADTISFSANAQVTLSESDTQVEVNSTNPVTLKNGETSCTFELTVQDGYRISASSDVAGTKVTFAVGAATKMSDGSTNAYKWTVTVSNVTADTTVTVTAATQPTINITNSDSGTGNITEINGAAATGSHTITMKGNETSGTITLLVVNGKMPTVSGASNMTVKTPVKGAQGGTHTTWTIEYSGVTAACSFTLNTAADTTGVTPAKDLQGTGKVEVAATADGATVNVTGSGESNFTAWDNTAGGSGFGGFTNPDADEDEFSVVAFSLSDIITKAGYAGKGNCLLVEVTNPALAAAYTDTSAEHYPGGFRLTGTYTGSALLGSELSVLLKNGSAPVTVRILEVSTTDDGTGAVHTWNGYTASAGTTDYYVVSSYTITINSDFTSTAAD